MRTRSLFAAFAALPLCAASAQAVPYCSPKTNAARILTKPSPNSIHPHWQGDSFIGTGWAFNPKKIISNLTGRYALGDLRGSRGGVTNRNVYILLSEWDCSDMN